MPKKAAPVSTIVLIGFRLGLFVLGLATQSPANSGWIVPITEPFERPNMLGESPPRKEFQGRIPLLAASALCFSTGMGATMFYGLGAFMPPLQAEFGWSRSQISFGATIMSAGSFLFGTVIGMLSDRFGAHRVAALSYLAYGLAILLVVPLFGTIWSFWIFSFLVSTLGQGSTPVVLVRPVVGAFRASRGLALGIVATGSGLGAFWVPRMIAGVTAFSGWRAAYVTVALIAIGTAPIAWIWLREMPPGQRDADDHAARPSDGMSPREARRTTPFWMLTAVSLAMASAVSGIVIHMVPFLRDAHMDPILAASIASLAGLASIAGRVGMGLLLDRFDTALVSICALLCAAAGILLLLLGGAPVAIPSILLIGFALGAETDMIAFMTARVFGKAHYGALYGWLFAIFTVGYGISPFLIGGLHDHFGSYTAGFEACLALLAIASGLIAALRPTLRNPKYDY